MRLITEEQPLQGIAQLLVHENLLTRDDALSYQRCAKEHKTSVLTYLIDHNILASPVIARHVAQRFGMPFFDLTSLSLENIPLHIVNEKLIRRHMMLPIHCRGNHVYLATDDPSRQLPLKEIQFHTGLHPHSIVVESDKLTLLIEQLLNRKELSQELGAHIDVPGSELDVLEISADHEALEDDTTSAASDDAPVVKFVNKILLDAVKRGASDIHFEPYEREYRVRYRQDGMLTEIATPPIALAGRITARIKVMSSLDISERRVPQDGRFKMQLSKTRAIDFRVSTCPTVGGEKVVIRILDPASTKLGIEALGFNALQEQHFLKSIERPQGMILVTGPTGSGKTVTLYSALNLLNTLERNISTAEDPVELKVPGINQVNINPKVGLTFAGALRSFLRQDPDIIMVGEIRDLETAEIAVKAAQTGHLVLSTLHTNSSAETLTRLVSMGIPSFNIASSVSLIIAQRLVRRLCEQCKERRDDIRAQSLLDLGFSETEAQSTTIYRAKGCNQCNKGYRGRVGLFEVMPMTKAIGQIIMSGGNSLDILKQAQQDGMLTIYQSGLVKIRQGITSIEEINRVTVD
ncbi:MAG: type IV-A pilus assembly ATPase PilB [Legionellaceae bacterium]|nr:type IV-A pilus assembly ATPase PilB [Legionellaceae bacterium]